MSDKFETMECVERGAGVLMLASDTGRILLLLRSDLVEEPYVWGIPGGRIDNNDTSPEEAAKRELKEETKYIGSLKLHPAYIFNDKNFTYYNFIGIIPYEFIPSINWEHDKFQWFDLEYVPKNVHFGVRILLEQFKDLIIRLRKS